MLLSASCRALSRLPVGSCGFLPDCDCDLSVLYGLCTSVSFANFLTRALTTFALESADSVSPAGPDDDSSLQCPACESRSLRLVSSTAKPSWSTVLTHFDARCPSWYAEQEYKELCDYLDHEYGISYEDWCLEMRIESAMRE